MYDLSGVELSTSIISASGDTDTAYAVDEGETIQVEVTLENKGLSSQQVDVDFVDEVLGRKNTAATEAAWVARYGEPLPPARRPGRKPREPRTERVSLLLSPSELAAIDHERGSISRNEYIRRLVMRQLKASRHRAT